jgi:hypothetical protein
MFFLVSIRDPSEQRHVTLVAATIVLDRFQAADRAGTRKAQNLRPVRISTVSAG